MSTSQKRNLPLMMQDKQEFKKFGNMTIILQKYVFKYKKIFHKGD
jgi:hypothetical protein